LKVVGLDQALVEAFRRAAGGEADRAVGLLSDLFDDGLGGPVAEGFVVVYDFDEHGTGAEWETG